MEIQRKKNENNNNYNYYLINNNNKVEINYASDNDLFFITSSKKEQIEFYITKDNMFIYNLFDLLFKSFEDASLFQISYKQLLKYCDIESQIKLYKKITEANQKIKDSYLYQKLFANNKIVWISDDSISFDEQTADTMEISKENNFFKLKFKYNESKLSDIKKIRIRSFNSRYNPFNIFIIDCFLNLQNYNPDYHQIHLEEYLQLKRKY